MSARQADVNATAALTVLVVEDDADGRLTLEEAIRSLGHSCSTARDGLEGLQMHQANRADVILADWKMPRMDGIELCKAIREEAPGQPYVHFIFVTASGDKAHFIRGMNAGADDYLAKPVDLDELRVRLVAAQRVVSLHRRLRGDNSALRHDSERAQAAARTDSLTGAFNRLALKEDLDVLAARASRYGHRCCCALFDVDAFKAYNDHFGHIPGDDALRRVARAIRDNLRRGDVLYRYGGEEFLVILPEQALTEGARAMDRVRQQIEALEIRNAPGAGSPFVSTSVGVAALRTLPQESVDDWLRRADAALYLAKARGRNRVAVEDDA